MGSEALPATAADEEHDPLVNKPPVIRSAVSGLILP